MPASPVPTNKLVPNNAFLNRVLWYCAMLAIAVTATVAASAAEYQGSVTHITDGDTFEIGDVKIRLCGIDAPERNERDFFSAANAFREIVEGQTIRCVQVGDGTVCDGRSRATNRGRIVAQCFVGDLDIGDELVRQGAACDWADFSGGHYSRNGGAQCR